MSKIKVMSPELANMIAAGEVIERPSSVIKELAENSIDAHAKHISIAVFNGGKEMISVKDDGDGMDRDDACLAFQRHASSKIKSIYDLMKISTLGFRGEALPSIASVSKVRMVTSTGEGVGTEADLIPGEDVKFADAALRKGTAFEVKELFYNTPARLKYLKSERSENASSIEIGQHLALGFPDVAFDFALDGKEVFSTTGRGDLLETINSIYGKEIAKNCLPFFANGDGYQVSGFICHPEVNYSTRYSMLTFLNRRSVYIPKVQKAIIDGYKDYLPPARYPMVVLQIEVDYSLVDVNVHPSKKEVRLSCEEELAQDINKAVLQTLLQLKSGFHDTSLSQTKPETPYQKTEPSANIQVPEENKEETSIEIKEDAGLSSLFSKEENVQPVFTVQDSNGFVEKNEDLQPVEMASSPSSASFPNLIPIGQVLMTYIVCDSEDGIYLIDQHAAAERINFEKCQAEFEQQKTLLTPLFPTLVDLTPVMKNNYDEGHIEALDELGIKTELFGSSSIKVVEVPSFLTEKSDDSVLVDIITQVLSDAQVNTVEIERKAIATKACHMSIKANNILTHDGQVALIKNLSLCRNPLNCPHGRPTVVKLSKYEIEKLFKRNGFK